MEQGITQVSSVPSGSPAKVVWNFPLELTLKSTNVYGWPQIVIEVHGTDFL
jgi:B9 domain-containing protein 1